MLDKHRLHLGDKFFVVSYLIMEVSDRTHKSFFNPPIRMSALRNLSLIVVHVCSCKVQERKQIVRSTSTFLLAFNFRCRHV